MNREGQSSMEQYSEYSEDDDMSCITNDRLDRGELEDAAYDDYRNSEDFVSLIPEDAA